jgi:hypothetical protein
MSDHRNKLEAYVAEKMREVYKYARPTIASGATDAEKGDIKNPWFGIECKQKKHSKSFTIPYADWYKNCGESDNAYKDPVFIVENEDGEKIAAMRLDEWFQLVYELMGLRTKLEE